MRGDPDHSAAERALEAGTLARALAVAAGAAPARVYASFDGAPLTLAELDARANAIAAALLARGLAPGSRVAVMMRNSPESLALIVGLSRIGAVWVPINVQQRGDGLRYVLDHCQPALIVLDADVAGLVAECGAAADPGLVVVNDAAGLGRWLAHPADPVPASGGPDALFAIMYTSGTTGPPKGVMVTHRMFWLAAAGVSAVADARDGDTFLVWEPLFHIGGAQLLGLPLLHAIELAFVERFSASRFWSQVHAHRASHIHYLGGILQILLKQPASAQERGHRVRVAWGGGCPPDIFSEVERRFGVTVRECYGMTECSSITTYSASGEPGVVGTALPWFDVAIESPEGTPLAPGTRGEIVVRTSLPGAIFEGYFRNPEATAAALDRGAMRTGDLGSLRADGTLLFHGRIKDSVRCMGENVSAWEVEHVVNDHPAVEECAIIGVAADIGEQDIKLFVKPVKGATLDPADLIDWLAPRLARYQLPRYVATVDAFERTPSKRIMKHRLDPSRDACWDRLSAGARGR